MKHHEVKKLFNGFASLRDYLIKAAVKDRSDIQIHYKNKIMTVPLERLKSKWQMHGKKFESKFNNQSYTLYDFKFVADSEKKELADKQLTLI